MSKHLNFAAALKSFEGYLEGTSKSEHTIRNYHFDLLAFEKFLLSYDKRPEVKLEELDQSYIEEFHNWLKKDGLKTNTRRRKLHTVRKFLGYLSRRKKVPETLDRKVAAPQKVERIPFIVPSEVLIGAIRALPVETVLDRRNRILLWTLAETGCQVSELRQIRFEDWQCSDEHSGNCALRLHGKAGRTLPVSRDLLAAVQELPLNATDYLFIGFN
ncbi:MAG TPA: hypothetical protein DCS07_01135 [Bdellovibrionales bacterium]|nr:hypothetical protein [Bdellovibrionales bacterium]